MDRREAADAEMPPKLPVGTSDGDLPPAPGDPQGLTPVMARKDLKSTYSDDGFVPGRGSSDTKGATEAEDPKKK